MLEFKEYLVAIAICCPLLLFIIAVIFRLLDNSAAALLEHDVLIDSSYVSDTFIKKQIILTKDEKLKNDLMKSLIFRRVHNVFMVMAVVSLPPVIIVCIVLLI